MLINKHMATAQRGQCMSQQMAHTGHTGSSCIKSQPCLAAPNNQQLLAHTVSYPATCFGSALIVREHTDREAQDDKQIRAAAKAVARITGYPVIASQLYKTVQREIMVCH